MNDSWTISKPLPWTGKVIPVTPSRQFIVPAQACPSPVSPSSSRLVLHKPQPLPYCPSLTPVPSVLCPHCLAADCLHLWVPASAHSTRCTDGTAAPVTDEDLDWILSVVGAQWEVGTHTAYGSALLIFHVWCDNCSIPEERQCPLDHILLLTFLTPCAGSYAGSSLKNMFYGLCAWHVLHGQPWRCIEIEAEAALAAGEKLAPPMSHRPKCAPFTPDIIVALRAQLDLTISLDAVVFACMTTTFWLAARLGEFTTRTLTAFDPTLHVNQSDMTSKVDQHGNKVMNFHLPHTKCSFQGEDVYWATQNNLADPTFALKNHFAINSPSPGDFLFSWRHSSSRLRPLTCSAFLARVNQAAAAAGLDSLQGHGLQIGSVLEYLLRGVPLEVVKTIGCWSSEAFTLYLCKHAVVIAPYIQDSPVYPDFSRITMPVLPPVH